MVKNNVLTYLIFMWICMSNLSQVDSMLLRAFLFITNLETLGTIYMLRGVICFYPSLCSAWGDMSYMGVAIRFVGEI